MKSKLAMFASSLLLSSLGWFIIKPAIAQSTAVPITYIAFPTPGGDTWVAEFVVPDRNPRNVSAYGQRLSRYDVHIAKMFEITDYQCLQEAQAGRNLNRIFWRYYTDNRNSKVGAFEIHCQHARQIGSQYRFLSEKEPTDIFYYRAETTVNIPVLAITGAKVDQWLDFLNRFRPEGMD